MEIFLLITLVLALVGAIYFKEDRDFYEKVYKEYKDDYLKLLDERIEEREKAWKNNISLLKEIKEQRTYLKAVLYNLDNKEIIIQEIDKKIRGEIQVTKDLVRYAETIKLVPEEEIKKL